MAFDRNSPEYRTCCCHVKTATIVIGVLEAIQQFVGIIVYFCVDNNTADQQYVFAGIMSAWAFVLVMLFVGIAKENHWFLLPYLIIKGIGLFLFGLAIIKRILSFTGAIALNIHHEMNMEVIGIIIAYFIVLFLVLGLQLWFLYVVLKCFLFFRDQRRFSDVPSVAYQAYA